jgi:hypothetical protein
MLKQFPDITAAAIGDEAGFGAKSSASRSHSSN